MALHSRSRGNYLSVPRRPPIPFRVGRACVCSTLAIVVDIPEPACCQEMPAGSMMGMDAAASRGHRRPRRIGTTGAFCGTTVSRLPAASVASFRMPPTKCA